MRKLWFVWLICVLLLVSCQKDGGSMPAESATDPTSAVATTLTAPPTDAPKPPPSVPAPPKGTEIKVTYTVNVPCCGSISGATEQTVLYGETITTMVEATANPGYRFVGWSDGSKTMLRMGDCPRTDTVYTAIFEYAPLELPMLHITTETKRDVSSKTQYIEGTVTITNCPQDYFVDRLEMEIRGRGNSSWNMEKKSYRLRLSEKWNLLGLGKGEAKSWVLLANHADQSLLRNHITMEFARKLNGLAFMPASTAVELYLNDEYRGVYLLCEQNEVHPDRVDIAENPESLQTGYFFEMTHYAVDPQFIVNGRAYELKNDLSSSEALRGEQIEYIRKIVERCWSALQRGDETLIRSYIDVPSAVDAYIVEELFKNKDDGWDSFYFYYDASVEGEVLHFGPIWDFDLTGGNTDSGGELPHGWWAGVSECITDNQWFIKLMQFSWFRQLVQERWNELKSEIDRIPHEIIRVAEAGFGAYSRNFEKWQIFGQWINQQPPEIMALDSYTQHYEYYANWMQIRIRWLDEAINGASFVSSPLQ